MNAPQPKEDYLAQLQRIREHDIPELQEIINDYINPPKEYMAYFNYTSLVKEDFDLKQGEYWLIKKHLEINHGFGYVELKKTVSKFEQFLLKSNPLLASAFPTKNDAVAATKELGIKDVEFVQVKEFMTPYVCAFILEYDLIIELLWDDGTAEVASEAILTRYPTLMDHYDYEGIDMFKLNDENTYNEFLSHAKELKIDLINKIHNRILDVRNTEIDIKNCMKIKPNS